MSGLNILAAGHSNNGGLEQNAAQVTQQFTAAPREVVEQISTDAGGIHYLFGHTFERVANVDQKVENEVKTASGGFSDRVTSALGHGVDGGAGAPPKFVDTVKLEAQRLRTFLGF